MVSELWAKKTIAVVIWKVNMSDYHAEHLQTPEINSRTEMDFVSQKNKKETPAAYARKIFPFSHQSLTFLFLHSKILYQQFFSTYYFFSSVVCTFPLCDACLFKLFRKRRSQETGCLAYSHILAQSTSPHWTLHRSQLQRLNQHL